jgi:hypothetical protein
MKFTIPGFSFSADLLRKRLAQQAECGDRSAIQAAREVATLGGERCGEIHDKLTLRAGSRAVENTKFVASGYALAMSAASLTLSMAIGMGGLPPAGIPLLTAMAGLGLSSAMLFASSGMDQLNARQASDTVRQATRKIALDSLEARDRAKLIQAV